MSSPYFDFKQFRVFHDRCAMKVGTDGVLLGAWARLAEGTKVLDLGTGCGLVALMMAQRFPFAKVTAVEIEPEAAAQAAENFQASPFAERLEAVCSDVRNFVPEGGPFDCIVSNPPFFTEDLLPPSAERSLARNAADLPFADLIGEAQRLLRPGGLFQVILPCSVADGFLSLCAVRAFSLLERMDVRTKPTKPAKRTLLCLVNDLAATRPCRKDFLLCSDHGERSADYQKLTQDFYL